MAVLVDVNVFMWVSKKKILGGNYGLVAGLPVTNSALSLAGENPVAGGGGFADSFYQPVTMGWHLKRADIIAAYAFFAPTGRFNAGASNNTGSGHWTNAPTAGETFYLTKNKGTAISAYEMYEFHTTQQGTNIHPGQTFDLDYSLRKSFHCKRTCTLCCKSGWLATVSARRATTAAPAWILSIPATTESTQLAEQQTSFCRYARWRWVSS